ncbi:GGDEF domain-containing protein [Clostridium autoethanogenum]|uniref:GGDEF domain-containing protein n=1 Tax=Clostridium autoethanogenum TaxID=84023 RepID=A0A3M0T2F5_9CLOT|nr:GGDEF domain-containing protein [Clostridium autoethanogenum]RMD04804.1 GGDEF domain-containing protein [Clostridium autoethanogenum]
MILYWRNKTKIIISREETALMMKKRASENYLIKILLIFIITAAFISALWLDIFYEIGNHKKNIIDAFSREQYSTTNQLSDRLQESLNDYVQNKGLTLHLAEEKVISEIIKKEINSQNKYMFFYNSKHILFERNYLTTEEYKGKGLKDSFNLWEYNGGGNLDEVKGLMNSGISGKGEIVKDSKEGKEIVSWCFFKVLNEKYVIGMSTSENYLFRETLFNQHVVRLYILGGIATMAIIILSAAFSLYLYLMFKKVKSLTNQLKNKNIQVQNFVSAISQVEKAARKATICDPLTGVYNRKFFYTILPKMNEELFFPITVIRVSIEGIKNVNNVLGRGKGDEVLVELAEILLESCNESDIVSRISDNKFVLIMINTGREAAFRKVDEIGEKIRSSFIVPICSIFFGVAVKTSETQNLFRILKSAEKNIRQL